MGSPTDGVARACARRRALRRRPPVPDSARRARVVHACVHGEPSRQRDPVRVRRATGDPRDRGPPADHARGPRNRHDLRGNRYWCGERDRRGVRTPGRRHRCDPAARRRQRGGGDGPRGDTTGRHDMRASRARHHRRRGAARPRRAWSKTNGTLRSVVHAAGISPTMGDWRRILEVDLVASAQPGRCAPSARDDRHGDRVLRIDGGPAQHAVAQRGRGCGRGRPAGGAPLRGVSRALGERRKIRHAPTRGPSGACNVWSAGKRPRWVRSAPHLLDLPGNDRHADGTPRVRAATDDEGARRHHTAAPHGPSRGAGCSGRLPLLRRREFVTGVDVLVDGGVCAAVESARSTRRRRRDRVLSAVPRPESVRTRRRGSRRRASRLGTIQ